MKRVAALALALWVQGASAQVPEPMLPQAGPASPQGALPFTPATVINVTDPAYGVVANNSGAGAANFTGFQAAATAACAVTGGAVIAIPSGVYTVATTAGQAALPIPCNSVNVIGAGRQATLINLSGTGDFIDVTPPSGSTFGGEGLIQGFRTFRNDSATSGRGVFLDHAQAEYVTDVELSGNWTNLECNGCGPNVAADKLYSDGINTASNSKMLYIHHTNFYPTTTGPNVGAVIPVSSTTGCYYGQTYNSGDSNIQAGSKIIACTPAGPSITLSLTPTGTTGTSEALAFTDINGAFSITNSDISANSAGGYVYGLLVQSADGLVIGSNVHIFQSQNASLFVQPQYATDVIDSILSTGATFFDSASASGCVDFEPYGGFTTTASAATPVITATGGSLSGSSVTLTWASPSYTIPVGATVTVAGVSPANWNATGAAVTASSSTSVTYTNGSATSTYSSGGTIQSSGLAITGTAPAAANGYGVLANGVPTGTTVSTGQGTTSLILSAPMNTLGVASGATVTLFPTFSGANDFDKILGICQGAHGAGVTLNDPVLSNIEIGLDIQNTDTNALVINAGTQISYKGNIFNSNRTNVSANAIIVQGSASEVTVGGNLKASTHAPPYWVDVEGQADYVLLSDSVLFGSGTGDFENNGLGTHVTASPAVATNSSTPGFSRLYSPPTVGSMYMRGSFGETDFKVSTTNGANSFPVVNPQGSGIWQIYGGGSATTGRIDAAATTGQLLVGSTNGDAISAAKPTVVSSGTTYVVLSTDSNLTFNGSGSYTITLPAVASYTGRVIRVRTIAGFTVISNASNVVPLAGGSAGTAILAGTAGKWAVLQSDGTNWNILESN